MNTQESSETGLGAPVIVVAKGDEDSGFGLSRLLIKESSTRPSGAGADHQGSGAVWEDSATLLTDSLRCSQGDRTGHGESVCWVVVGGGVDICLDYGLTRLA